jgi:hypothetical protein
MAANALTLVSLCVLTGLKVHTAATTRTPQEVS